MLGDRCLREFKRHLGVVKPVEVVECNGDDRPYVRPIRRSKVVVGVVVFVCSVKVLTRNCKCEVEWKRFGIGVRRQRSGNAAIGVTSEDKLVIRVSVANAQNRRFIAGEVVGEVK